MTRIQYEVATPIRPLYIVASPQGIEGTYWGRQSVPLVTRLRAGNAAEQWAAMAERQIGEYFAGARQHFDMPLCFAGTPFQEKVWRALSQIPFGRTVSYADIARRIGHPKAVRAVGNTNGRNPICLIIPCHRVITSNGTIGGYTGGISIKRRLLALEGVAV